MKGKLGGASTLDGKGMKEYFAKSYKAANVARKQHRNAAINKPSTMAGKIVAIPPPRKVL